MWSVIKSLAQIFLGKKIIKNVPFIGDLSKDLAFSP
jgi:hypothetical protein